MGSKGGTKGTKAGGLGARGSARGGSQASGDRRLCYAIPDRT